MPKRRNRDIKPYTLKDGTKKYRFKLYLGSKGHGKNRQKIELSRSGFKSYAEAEAVYKKLQAQSPDDYIKPKQYTLDEIWKKWLEVYKLDVRESTLNKTIECYSNHLKNQFGNEYIDQITTEEITDYFVELSKKMIKYKTVFGLLKRLLEYAIDLQLLEVNPARPHLLPKKSQVKHRDTKHNFYDAQQMKDFLAAAKEYDERAYVYFKLLATTGMRRGEALALTWKDIDYEHSVIRINKTLTLGLESKQILQKPKTGKDRFINLPEDTASDLKSYHKDLYTNLFHKKDGGYLKLTKPDKWRRAIYKANPDLKQITIHGFRHSYSTIMNAAGANPKAIQAQLGHAHLDMTMNVYTHVTNQEMRELNDLTNTIF